MTFTEIRLQHHQVNLGLHQETQAFETKFSTQRHCTTSMQVRLAELVLFNR